MKLTLKIYGLFTALGLLFSCGSYQAPVVDQGENQVNRPPEIVQSSAESGQLIVERSRTLNESTSGGGGGSFAQSRSNSRTQPNSAPVRSNSVSNGAQQQANNGSHNVKAGDTLYSIAYQYDLDFRLLAIANNLRPPYTIFVGQQINLSVSDTAANSADSAVNSNVGTAVSDNNVARSQGGSSRSSAVLRQPISRSSTVTPSWNWPHRGRVLTAFGQQGNKGLDISGRIGEPVLAAGDGDVVYSGRGIQGSGNLIILRHNDRYLSAYAHNQTMLVGEGDSVSLGQQIAEMGANDSNTPMLHFEIRLDGKSVDPVGLLPSK